MKFQLKIIHWIFFLWLIILIFNYDVLVGYLSLLIDFIILVIEDFKSALAIVNFSLIDSLVSSLMFLLIIPLVLMFKKKLIFLQSRLNFSIAILIVLGFIFIFAPIISNENPEFSKNLSVTKLLSPFSTVKVIELKQSENLSYSEAERFRIKMDEIIKPSYNENIIFADSVKLSQPVVYYQKNEANKIPANELEAENGIPVIKNKLFLFGTDEFGRDLFTRLLFGTRISITIGFGAVVLSLLIGVLLGFTAGYGGGFLDVLLNRFTETFLAFPVIYLVVLILALFGSSVISVIIVLGISGWMSLFKIVKSEVLSIKQKDFFSTAELVGLNKSQLLLKEVLPVIVTPVLVNLIFLFSNIVLAEAALSYLGLGIGSSYPSWGSMISSGQEYITRAWWLIAFPGLALILTLFSVNSSGRMLGKILNPRIKY